MTHVAPVIFGLIFGLGLHLAIVVGTCALVGMAIGLTYGHFFMNDEQARKLEGVLRV
jgi:hypothetical protein